jgi:hypothetical protein
MPVLLLIVLAFLSSVPTLLAWGYEDHDWHPAISGDSRSPCPGLNTLANHNYLPHNGLNLDAASVLSTIKTVYNISDEILRVPVESAILQSADPSKGLFNLSDLNRPLSLGGLEHDASLSREDYHIAEDHDSHNFNATIWKTVMAHFAGSKYVNVSSAAKARYARATDERRRDANFTYGPIQQFLSYGETVLYLWSMRETATGATPVQWVDIFFGELAHNRCLKYVPVLLLISQAGQERLPLAEGWITPNTTMDTVVFAQMLLSLALNTPEEAISQQ